MRSFIHQGLKLWLLLWFLSSSGSYAEIVYLDIGEWSPFTSEKESDGKIAEIIVKEAFSLEGIVVEYSYFPWKRSYERVKMGRSDGTFPWFFDADRGDPQYFIISKESVLRDREVLFYHVDRPIEWNDIVDLKKYLIGGVIGYSHIAMLRKYGVSLDVVSKEEQNYRKLMAGRLDATPGSQIVGYHMIHKLFPSDQAQTIVHHDKPLREAEMYIFFSRQRPNSLYFDAAFSKGIKKLKASGRYSAILDQAVQSDQHRDQ